MSAVNVLCKIPANPDISGLGVRIAIYVQNILSLVPAIWSLRDKNVSVVELETLEKQSVTILLTAFAILISTIVQALTSTVTNYHATIILNLSWMNNTNTFIYLLLFAHHKLDLWLSDSDRESALSLRLLLRTLWKKWRMEVKNGGEVKNGKEVFVTGSLHLTLMAAVGIWLWSRPANFGEKPTCSMAALVFGPSVHLSSTSYRAISLLAYSLILLPGFNLMIPAGFFFLLYHATHSLIHSFNKSTSNPIKTITLSISLGLISLLMTDIFFLVLTETVIKANTALSEPGDSDWTFGQILALLLLVVPLRELVETLLERSSRRLGELLLFLCQSDNHEIASYLVKLGAPIDSKGDSSKDTAAVVAAKQRHFKIAKTLIDNGAEKGHFTPREQRNGDDNKAEDVPSEPIHIAAELGVKEVMENLLKNQEIDINIPDHCGRYAIHLAASNGNEDIVELLVSKQAIINPKDNGGAEPIHLAAKSGCTRIVKLLAKNGADLNASDKRGRRPIHMASFHGHVEVVKFLVEQPSDCRVDLNVANCHGRRPIHLAAMNGHNRVVKALAEAGSKRVDLNASDGDNHRPIELAKERKHHDVVETLKRYGAKEVEGA
ncbi:hypothetical protein D9756_004323 [Leucocoprinus leucothites]|uniref:Uncharacterized protein n=1 Tax=Leucocoprinus leucothites TaxID=201217 RepID=A0A8H5D9T2_9AGAR|nr:hypothetical protein D9756_004323 [Leucoagaricus leucothites]